MPFDLRRSLRGAHAASAVRRPCRFGQRLVDTKAFAADTFCFGEVVGVTADEEVLMNGSLDWSKVASMLFTFSDKSYWKLGDRVAEAWSVGKGFSA